MPRHTVIPASYLFLKKDGEYLFARRFQTGYEDGKWSLPAGHVEEGETYTQCAIREAKEEIGVDIAEGDLKVAHVLHRDTHKTAISESVELFFVCEQWTGEPKNLEPNKCDGIEWFDHNTLPDSVIPYIRHIAEMIAKGVMYSEYGFDGIENGKWRTENRE